MRTRYAIFAAAQCTETFFSPGGAQRPDRLKKRNREGADGFVTKFAEV
jgi:hypothetical protein